VSGLARLQAWKICASVTIAWLAANPIPPMVFPSSLVNPLRFDKVARAASPTYRDIRRPHQTPLAVIS